MKDKDKRVKLMDEILNGIKVLKLYAWEPSFGEQILDIRENEIGSLKKAALLNAFATFLWTCAPVLVALSSFTVFVLISEENILDAQTAFVSLTYFNMLRIPLNFLPSLLVYLVQVNVSLTRINKFMNSEELDPDNVSHDEEFHSPVVAQKASFAWTEPEKPTLRELSFRVPEGSMTAVVGAVGSGKSSLLSALLGEMKRTQGTVNVFGKVAYVPQQAWIQNCTLQVESSTLIGRNPSKYCALIGWNSDVMLCRATSPSARGSTRSCTTGWWRPAPSGPTWRCCLAGT